MASHGDQESPKMVDLSQYISTKDAAEHIGCTIGRVQQMVRSGELKRSLKIGPNKVLIHKAEAEERRLNPAPLGRPRTRKPAKKAAPQKNI